jgi:hypothetical protein
MYTAAKTATPTWPNETAREFALDHQTPGDIDRIDAGCGHNGAIMTP